MGEPLPEAQLLTFLLHIVKRPENFLSFSSGWMKATGVWLLNVQPDQIWPNDLRAKPARAKLSSGLRNSEHFSFLTQTYKH